MFPPEKLFEQAFFTAIKKIEKGLECRQIPKLRVKNILPNDRRFSAGKCVCTDFPEITESYFRIFPLYPFNGNPLQGKYSLLPFYYLFSISDSKMIPIIEVFEIPILSFYEYIKKTLFFEKEHLDTIFSTLGKTMIISNQEVTQDNLKTHLPNMRKNIFHRIFDLKSQSSIMNFSIFTKLHKNVTENPISRYLASCSDLEKDFPGEFQSEKNLCVYVESDFFVFKLNTWAFNKSDLQGLSY